MKINIGGFKHNRLFKGKEWTIVDNHPQFGGKYKTDLHHKGLPFPDNSIEAVYTSHTIEHILPHRQYVVFSEMHRVLEQDGLVRIVVPDIDFAIRKYVNGENLTIQSAPSRQPSLPDLEICKLASWFFTYREKGDVLGGHVMAYNQELLTHYLTNAKFRNIVFKEYNDCSPIFTDCDLEMHRGLALYVEAQK